ncbi:hypothetical protein B2J93_30 [Marssonina coronariae]|uniref:Uncharacterized protein n=1 Tax=Diplocarpon coronariae TaxID=2795749 RepID=A0A218ZF87_9HELO|nr:hypothetical protein JHW43_008367 [Diplocarpon mali]OWP06739.1 hypothetical protein B2J93_30 [Marssonina coronariae]
MEQVSTINRLAKRHFNGMTCAAGLIPVEDHGAPVANWASLIAGPDLDLPMQEYRIFLWIMAVGGLHTTTAERFSEVLTAQYPRDYGADESESSLSHSYALPEELGAAEAERCL